uniref:Uncharacterized protein n=1 Tax=Chenopodium quinoa TaxID=63459 RepID=A0A803KQ60_CHEQI
MALAQEAIGMNNAEKAVVDQMVEVAKSIGSSKNDLADDDTFENDMILATMMLNMYIKTADANVTCGKAADFNNVNWSQVQTNLMHLPVLFISMTQLLTQSFVPPSIQAPTLHQLAQAF